MSFVTELQGNSEGQSIIYLILLTRDLLFFFFCSMQVSVLSRRATSFTVTTSKLVSRDLVSHLIWPHIEGEHAVYEYNVQQITQSHIIHIKCVGGGGTLA